MRKRVLSWQTVSHPFSTPYIPTNLPQEACCLHGSISASQPPQESFYQQSGMEGKRYYWQFFHGVGGWGTERPQGILCSYILFLNLSYTFKTLLYVCINPPLHLSYNRAEICPQNRKKNLFKSEIIASETKLLLSFIFFCFIHPLWRYNWQLFSDPVKTCLKIFAELRMQK